jgi:hypothetical protein
MNAFCAKSTPAKLNVGTMKPDRSGRSMRAGIRWSRHMPARAELAWGGPAVEFRQRACHMMPAKNRTRALIKADSGRVRLADFLRQLHQERQHLAGPGSHLQGQILNCQLFSKVVRLWSATTHKFVSDAHFCNRREELYRVQPHRSRVVTVRDICLPWRKGAFLRSAAVGIAVNGVTALLFMSGRRSDLKHKGACESASNFDPSLIGL